MDVPAAPTLSPQEALAAFKVAPGYRVELVAAEPLVVDPVAMTWDERGRLWVVEMRGYSAGTFQHEADHLDGVLFPHRVSDPTSFCSRSVFAAYRQEEVVRQVHELVKQWGA